MIRAIGNRTVDPKRWAFLLAATLLLCQAAEAADLRIENVSADRVGFRPELSETVTVRFRLSEPTRVEMRIYDSRDLLIRTVASGGLLGPGDASLVWDGRSDRKEPAPPEAYFYTLVARAETGQEVVFDVTDLSRGADESLPNLDFDASRRSVTYSIPGPSRVGLRVALRDNGPLLATLINWEPRVDLVGHETWPGVEGVADEGLELHGQYFAFPSNVIVVQPPPGENFEARFLDRAGSKRPREAGKRHMYQHSEHTRDECYDFPVTLELAGGVRERRDELPVIGEGASLLIGVPDEYRAFADNQRFETVFYLDGVFITEWEQGYVPFRWPMDTVPLPASEHVLTVNLRGYEGHFGCASIRFVKLGDPAVSASQSTGNAP